MKLIHGCSFTEIKKLLKEGIKVDCIATDPPFGMSFQSSHRKEKHIKIANDDNLDWLPEFVKDCYDLAKENTHHYFFCSFHFVDIFKQELQKHFKVKNILIWEKNNTSMGDLTADYAPKYEMVIFCHKGRRELTGKRHANIFKFARTGNEFHPTQKPVKLMEFLIGNSTTQNEIVFDPFMGSGTTGIACKNLNRDFIGIELEEKYFKTAENRIKNEQPMLFYGDYVGQQ